MNLRTYLRRFRRRRGIADRAIQVIFFIILIQAVLAGFNTTGIFTPVAPAVNVTNGFDVSKVQNQVGCSSYVVGNTQVTCTPSVQNGAVLSSLTIFGNWFSALVSLMSSFASGLILPGNIVAQLGFGLVIANMINVGVWVMWAILILYMISGRWL